MKRLETCRRLLKRVSLIAWRYDVGGPDAFNIFTVLRSESDEANLHTRFLAALLDHRKTGDIHRRNLEDFLVQVARIDGFGLAGAVVEREAVVKEYDRIDILISNKDRKQAVVIENKIEAGDQPQQLKKYAKQLQEKGYSVPSLLYLTLDGHGPSEDSRGGHKVNCISYKESYAVVATLPRTSLRRTGAAGNDLPIYRSGSQADRDRHSGEAYDGIERLDLERREPGSRP